MVRHDSWLSKEPNFVSVSVTKCFQILIEVFFGSFWRNNPLTTSFSEPSHRFFVRQRNESKQMKKLCTLWVLQLINFLVQLNTQKVEVPLQLLYIVLNRLFAIGTSNLTLFVLYTKSFFEENKSCSSAATFSIRGQKWLIECWQKFMLFDYIGTRNGKSNTNSSLTPWNFQFE